MLMHVLAFDPSTRIASVIEAAIYKPGFNEHYVVNAYCGLDVDVNETYSFEPYFRWQKDNFVRAKLVNNTPITRD